MSSLVVLNATHEEMQQVPYDLEMFQWLLQYQKNGASLPQSAILQAHYSVGTFDSVVPTLSGSSSASAANTQSSGSSTASVRDAVANAKSGAITTSASLSALLTVVIVTISSLCA